MNRHVLVSRTTALGAGPVTHHYLRRLLTSHIDLERIRQDRILHEAITNHADPLRLALVFGVDPSTATTTPTPPNACSPRPTPDATSISHRLALVRGRPW